MMNKKQLARKGRFGDSRIRSVGGESSHVNPSEARIIDKYGKLGEIVVKAQGAGTINPQTGLTEYHYKGSKDILNKHHNKAFYEKVDKSAAVIGGADYKMLTEADEIFWIAIGY